MKNNPEAKLHPFFTWRSYIASEHGPQSSVTRHVLLTIALHMNEKGESCFPSVDLLVKETRLSKPSIIKHIKFAVEEGWLEKRVLGVNGQGWRKHEYRPLIPVAKGGKGGLPPLKQCGLELDDLPVSQRGKGNLPPVSRRGKPNTKKVVKEVNPSTSMSTSYTAAKKTGCGSSVKKPLSDHAWFTSWWCFVSESVTGSKYPYKTKDAGQIKQLLKQLENLSNLISRSCVYFTLPEKKRFPAGITIGGLSYQIAQITDADGALIDRFIDNGYLPEPGTIALKDFQPWKEDHVSKSTA